MTYTKKNQRDKEITRILINHVKRKIEKLPYDYFSCYDQHHCNQANASEK